MEESLKNSLWLILVLAGFLHGGETLTITPQPETTSSSLPTNDTITPSSTYDNIVTTPGDVTNATTSSTTEPQPKDIVFPGITASNLTIVNTSDSIWRQALDNRPSPWKGFVVLDTPDLTNPVTRNSMQTSTSSFPTSHLTSSWSTTPRTIVFFSNPPKSLSNLPPIYFSPSTPAPPTSGYPRPTVIPVPYGDNQRSKNSQRDRDNQNYGDGKSNGGNANPYQYRNHPNQDHANPNRYNVHPNRDNANPNRYNVPPNRDNANPNRYNVPPNRDNASPNPYNLHSNQANADPNHDKVHPNRYNQPYGDSQRNREYPMEMKYVVHGRNMADGKSYRGTPPATFSISSAPMGSSMNMAPSYGPNMPMAPAYGSSMSSSVPAYGATKPQPPMSPMNGGGSYGPQGVATGTGYEASYSHDYGSTYGGGYGHMLGYGGGAHGYGGYVTPKEDFGLKGLLSKLLTFIPIGLLLAVALPSLIVIPNRRSVSDGASAKGYVENYPILDMISYYGVDSLQDDTCLRHILCKTVRMGSHQGANVFQKHLWTVVNWMDKETAQKMGLRNLWSAVKEDECSKYSCRKSKPDKIDTKQRLV